MLIEGRWIEKTPEPSPSGVPWKGGFAAAELSSTLAPLFDRTEHHPLSDDPSLWGRAVTDERYALVARRIS